MRTTIFGKKNPREQQIEKPAGVGLPGVNIDNLQLTPQEEAEILLRRETVQLIGQNEIADAVTILNKYNRAKQTLKADLLKMNSGTSCATGKF